MRNEEECVCSVCLFRCNIFNGVRIIKEMPGLVASGTPCMIWCLRVHLLSYTLTHSLMSVCRDWNVKCGVSLHKSAALGFDLSIN